VGHTADWTELHVIVIAADRCRPMACDTASKRQKSRLRIVNIRSASIAATKQQMD
jgi:hypothetical protein